MAAMMKTCPFTSIAVCLFLLTTVGSSQEHPDSVDYEKIKTDALMEALDFLEITPSEG